MWCAIASLLVLTVIPCHAAWTKVTALSDEVRAHHVNVTFTTGDFLEGGTHMWVAGHYRGEDGLRVAVFRTEDGGRRWIGTYTDIGATPATVLDFVDVDHGWLLAGDSAIYRTEDAGRSWQAETIRSGIYSLHNLVMVGRENGFAVGSTETEGRAAVFKYRADDHEWRRINAGTEGAFRALAARSVNRVWTAGLTVDGDYIALRRAGSSAWRTMTVPSQVQALSFTSDSHGWAACTSGRIFATADGGATWTEQKTPVFYDLCDILFPPGSAKGVAIAAEAGAVLTTTDGGETWRVARGPERASKILWDGERFLVVARDGLYLQPATIRFIPSLTMQRRPSPETQVHEMVPMPGPYVTPWHQCRTIEEVRGSATMRAACFLADGEHGWVLTDSFLLRTRNGALSWEWITRRIEAYHTRGITFTDARNGWVWGGAPCIWRTRDGGNSWEVENVDGGWDTHDFVLDLDMFDDQRGLALLDFGSSSTINVLSRSPETGIWSVTEHNLPRVNQAQVMVRSPGSAWAMSDAWNGLRTRRFPEMERMSLGTETNYRVRSIFFRDRMHGWVAAGPMVFHTGSGGEVWEAWYVAGSDPANYPLDLTFDTYSHGYMVTRLGQVLETDDYGETWHERYRTDRPNLISIHHFGDYWWALAEDALYTNSPTPPPRPSIVSGERRGPALARALLVWSDIRGWADNGVRPNRGIRGREARFGVRWDGRNADPPADLRLLVRTPDGTLYSLDLRPVDYFAAQERPGGSDWGVAYTPPVAGEYAFRFVGSDAAGNACHGDPVMGESWQVR